MKLKTNGAETKKKLIELFFSSLININENREVLSEATQSEHVVARIPLAVGDQV